MVPGNLGHELKLAGIGRYCATRGWDVEAVERKSFSTAALPEILRKRRPVGCVVEGINNEDIPPPRLFGKVPVSYLECPPEVAGDAPDILVDDDAIAREALRELSAGRPSCYAVVGSFRRQWWSARRVRAFRRTVATETGHRCAAFPFSGESESFEEYLARLSRWTAALPANCAVFAVSDMIAKRIASIAAAASRGIPRELTLLSVDNHPEICEACSPPVSSIQLDLERMGFLAAQALCDAGAARRRRRVVGPLLAVRRKSTSGRGRHEKFIIDAVAAIRREARGGLTAGDLAARYPVSRRLFEMRFRDATGHSVLDEIMHVRLEAVQAMLARPDIPIGAIADFCGFTSYLTMQKAFRKRTGLTLGKWRRRL